MSSDGTDRCPICNEAIRDGQETEYWGQVKKVYQECNPETQAGVGP